jgi:hypothetical protein
MFNLQQILINLKEKCNMSINERQWLRVKDDYSSISEVCIYLACVGVCVCFF